MIVFLCGTPGVGKTTVAHELQEQYGWFHTEVDSIRDGINPHSDRKNQVIEEAVNWRVFELAVKQQRSSPSSITLIESTGASKHYAYLRYALGDIPQKLIRLSSSFLYGRCQQKWNDQIPQKMFEHIAGLVATLKPDLELIVDGKTARQVAQEIYDSIG